MSRRWPNGQDCLGGLGVSGGETGFDRLDRPRAKLFRSRPKPMGAGDQPLLRATSCGSEPRQWLADISLQIGADGSPDGMPDQGQMWGIRPMSIPFEALSSWDLALPQRLL